MKYLSLFSGIGGFELGIGDKHECIGFSEIDKYATQIYQKHFPNHQNHGDITKINVQELPDFDLLVGGFPCQAFSIAGKRKGFEDTRGTLFFEIARILQAKQPRLFLLENVKGLLSHDNGNTFKTIISTLTELGYDLQWQVLNSKNHGVPQNRERVFIIGHLRGTSRPEVFPFRQDDNESIESRQICTSATVSTRTGSTAGGQQFIKVRHEIGKVKIRKYPVKIKELQELLRSHRNLTIKEVADQVGIPQTMAEHWFRTDNSFSIPDAEIWDKLKEVLQIKTDEFDKSIKEFEIRDNKYDMANRIYESSGISPTLTTPTGGQQHIPIDDGFQIRRLTPIECERLQGFPDGWTEGVSDTQRYKTLGNAVTVNVIRDIMEKLLI